MLSVTQLGIVALIRSWREIFLWKTRTRTKREKAGQKNAMRTVESTQAMSEGKGLIPPPFPRAPNLAHTLPLRCCSFTAKKGTFLSS